MKLLCAVVLTAILLAGCHSPPNGMATKDWSSPSSWPGGQPIAGEDVTIPKGCSMNLNVSQLHVGRLIVDGELIVPDGDHEIRAKSIVVNGAFRAGSQLEPHQGKLLVGLDATDAKQDATAGIFMVNGELALFGAFKGPGWTRLAGDLTVGSREIALAQTVNWPRESVVTVAATGFDPTQTEEFRLSLSAGRSGKLDTPALHRHFGRETFGVNEQAEVACLTRPIHITSKPGSPFPKIGASLMVMRGGTAQLAGVEFSHMGRIGEKGMYPVHFHLAGDQHRSFLQSCSIHDCYNRGLTLHGTNHLAVEDLAIFNSIGHLVFLEDGVESGNVFRHCLAMQAHNARVGQAILTSDRVASGFWVTRPGNDFVDCTAAGCDGQGFWLAFPKHPTGPSATNQIWPRQENLGRFDGNVSHSNLYNGLFVDGEANPPGIYETPDFLPPSRATFNNFTAYKNGKRGAWLRGNRLILRHSHLADQAIGLTFAAADATFEDSVVVGESENGRGTSKPGDPQFPIRGFEFYDGPVAIRRVTFRNFQPTAARRASALSALRFSPFFMAPTSSVESVRFENAQPVFFDQAPKVGPGPASSDGYRSVVFLDKDGSLGGSTNSTVAIGKPFLTSRDARVVTAWNASITRGSFAHLTIEVAAGHLKNIGILRISRFDRPGASHELAGSPEEGKRAIYQSNLLANQAYWLLVGPKAMEGLRVSISFAHPGQTFSFVLPKESLELAAIDNIARRHGVRLSVQAFQKVDGRYRVTLTANKDGVASALISAPRLTKLPWG